MPDELTSSAPRRTLPDWPTIVQAIPFTNTDDVTWRDGKPWCARHSGVVLVRARAVGVKRNGHVCASCMRETMPLTPLSDHKERQQ